MKMIGYYLGCFIVYGSLSGMFEIVHPHVQDCDGISGDEQTAMKKLRAVDLDDVDCRDEQGRTALHYACIVFNTRPTVGIIWQLILAGASTEIQDNDGYRPLDLVVRYSDAADVSLIFSDAKQARTMNITKDVHD